MADANPVTTKIEKPDPEAGQATQVIRCPYCNTLHDKKIDCEMKRAALAEDVDQEEN